MESKLDLGEQNQWINIKKGIENEVTRKKKTLKMMQVEATLRIFIEAKI